MLEHRQGGEVRAEGRRLSGTVLRFGEVSPSHRERFEAGAFAFAEAVPLNLAHDAERAVAWQPGGGLELRQDDDSLSMAADLPPIPAADRALAMVRSGSATGLSIEFQAMRERREDGIRVVEQALLTGVGIVRSPSYSGSRVEARAGATWARGRIKPGKRSRCDCLPEEGIIEVQFKPAAFDRLIDKVEAGERDVPAFIGGPMTPSSMVASTRRGTMRLRKPKRGGLTIELTGASRETQAAKSIIETQPTAPVSVRPLINNDASTFEDRDGLRIYEEAEVRAVLLKWAPAEFNWGVLGLFLGAFDEPEDDDGEDDEDDEDRRSERRRVKAWL